MYPMSNPATNANPAHLAKSWSVQIAESGKRLGSNGFIAFTVFDKLYQGIYLDQHGTTVDVFEFEEIATLPAQLVYIELFI